MPVAPYKQPHSEVNVQSLAGKGKPASCSRRLLQITDRRPPISNSRLRSPAQLQQFLLAEVPPIARIRPHAAKAGLGFENQ